MRFRPDRYRELRSMLRPDAARDIDEELLHHVEQLIADGIASGMSEDAAREDALRRFGNVDRYRRETIALDELAKREERRMQVFDAIRRETAHALRSLLRSPLFFLVALLTLAMGIGSTSAIFTLLDSIVLQPLPYAQSERLVQVTHAVPGVQAEARWGTSVAQYFHYVDNNRSFEQLGAWTTSTFALAQNGEAERVEGGVAIASLLDVLGLRVALGRPFTSADEVRGGADVVLLSHELWQSMFNGDPAILNREVRVNGTPRTVIGVLAAGAHLPQQQTRLWVPLQVGRADPPVNSHWLSVIGRLRPGVSADAARADLRRMLPDLIERFPNAYSQGFYDGTGFTPRVVSVRSEVLGGIERVLWVLLAAVLLVLLIGAANVANLFMVRTEGRRREIALRCSLGAERAHLAVHYLAEALMLSLLAALLGLALAYAGTRLLVATAPAGLPRLDEVAISWRVVLVAFATAVTAGMIFGLFPVIRSRIDYGMLREGGRGLTTSRGQHRARSALVVGQMAMALVLLTAGGLLLESYLNLRSVDDGIDPRNVLTFEISAPISRYPEHTDVRRFYRDLTTRIEALPGVLHAAGTVALPFASGGGCAHTVVEGQQADGGDQACVPTPVVLPGYFESLGIPVRGRSFDWSMLDRREGVAIISRALANRFFPGEDPVGKGIMSFRDGPPWYRIIGVAEDVRQQGYDRPPVQAIYYPQMPMDIEGTWMPARSMTMTVRTRGELSDGLAASIRGIVRDLDAEVPIANVQSMEDVIRHSESVARASFTLLLLSVAAAMALFLSVVGMYGVMSYVVAQRRSEIGVRMALGARADQVRQMVLRQSILVALVGVAIGVPAAVLGARLLRTLLFGVSPSDPAIIAAVALTLLTIAGIASYIPALRAAAVPPMQVLRDD